MLIFSYKNYILKLSTNSPKLDIAKKALAAIIYNKKRNTLYYLMWAIFMSRQKSFDVIPYNEFFIKV
jgi:hypothetical protein